MLKKTHLEVFDLIKKTERQELTHLRSCNLYLWPLLRYQIVSAAWNEDAVDNHLTHEELAQGNASLFSLSFVKKIKFKIMALKEMVILKRSLKKVATSHLFFYRQEECMADANGIFVSNIGEGAKLLFNDIGLRLNSVNLDDYDISKALSFEFYLLRGKVYEQLLEDKIYKKLLTMLTQHEKDCLRIDFQWIIDDITTILAYKKIFTKLLKSMKAKKIFYTVFYHPRSLALALAAHELKITSTEIQHGLDGEVNALEMEYNYIPKNGYEMLPDIFWQWGEISQKRKQCFKDFAKILNLGHPGNYYQIQKASFMSNFSKDKRHIVYALQPVEDPVPQFILDAIKDPSLKHYQWHFRLHPRMVTELQSYVDLYEHLENVSVLEATDAFMGNLLHSCDVVISKTSTVLLEGLSFNKLPIAIHPNALDMYRSEIENGKIHYANSLGTLIPLMSCRYPVIDNSQYISQNYDEIKKEIHKVYLCAE